MTIVLTALATARYLQTVTGMSIKKIITTSRPLQDVTGRIRGQHLIAVPEFAPEARAILEKLKH